MVVGQTVEDTLRYIICVHFPQDNIDDDKEEHREIRINRSMITPDTDDDLPCYSTSPTSALQVLSGLMPLDIKAEMERKFFRLIHYKENLEISNLVIWYNTLEERVPHFHTHPAHQDIIPWHKNTPTQKNIEIFTDGSKMGKHVGAAFVMYNNGHEVHSEIYRLNDMASVFQAEVLALKKALIWIGSTITDNIPIRSHSLELNWIKAHIGTAGADSEAKRATQQDQIDVEVPLSEVSAKHQILQESLKTWQQRWNEDSTGRSTYAFFPQISLSRIQSDHILNQILTNHVCTDGYESVTAAVVHPNKEVMHFTAIYNPPKHKFSDNILNNLLSEDQQVIIPVDINAKHMDWGCRRTNANELHM
ncbi:uncharacterized protein LOC118194258 [Stegodyphus dumicola]|uniref:uncharacterized protein LOC118194258 n=1 Tax=Stegodyphus dumicola TaxID=202533 RepID=UPI0015AAA597|nr:uncharacterized protein LOC118194258 [Stegodyphus dumicola]